MSDHERHVPHVPDAAIVGEHALISGFSAWFLAQLIDRRPGGLERLLLRSSLSPERRRDVLRAARALEEVGTTWRLEQARAGSGSGTAGTTEPANELPSEDGRVELERDGEAAFALPPGALSASDAARVLGISSRRVRVLADTGSLRGHRDSGGRWWFAPDVVERERARRLSGGVSRVDV